MGQLIHRYKGAVPYLLMLPGLLWLLVFFVVPNIQMLVYSLSTGTLLTGFVSARTGRSFKAFLVLKDDGKVGFEFAPREPKPGAKTDAAPGAKPAKKAAAKPKAARPPRKAK